jgi:hypothetical protein
MNTQTQAEKAVKEIPMLLSTPMVQAILEGRKTKTRRICRDNGEDVEGFRFVKDNPTFPEFWKGKKAEPYTGWVVKYKNLELWLPRKCPFGKPGDIIWVREKWRKYCPVDANGYTNYDTQIIEFAADNPPLIDEIDADGFRVFKKDGSEKFISWRPSIYMPKSAARIWLQVEDIRVERVQDITEEDAEAEGVEQNRDESWHDYLEPKRLCQDDASASFQSLWQYINGEESWQTNPFVWVISFKVLSTTGKP